jgi:hypothetical protein
MGYKPQAEFYYSCKTVKDPFGIERDGLMEEYILCWGLDYIGLQ